MPIFRSAYDTTFGRRYSSEASRAAIVKATVSNYLAKNNDGFIAIEDSSNWPIDIPDFTHPLYVDKEPCDGLYIDARPYVTPNRQTGELKVNSVSDYNLLKARAGLEHLWRTMDPEAFRAQSVYPASVYAHWLAENIQKRRGLDAQDQYKLTVFSAWFYYSLFDEADEPDERTYLRIVPGIAKATGVGAEKVMEVLDGQPYVKSITDYCERLEDATGSIRLKDFSTILLYPILGSTWFGARSADMVGVGVEHIPTWHAMVMSALTERSYLTSSLAKMAERVPAKNASRDFVLQTTAALRRKM